MPELRSQHQAGVLIVRFNSCKILSDWLITQAGRELLDLAEQTESKLLLDLHGVTYMSSLLVAKILLVNNKCRARRTQFKLCNVDPNVMEVFAITRLYSVISIHSSADDAMSAFDQSAQPERGFAGRLAPRR